MTTSTTGVPELTRGRRWIALSVLALAVLLIAVDATVLAIATPFLSEDLEPTGVQLLWIGDSYGFVIAGLLVSMGSLGDRIGRKKLLLIGASAFGLISILNAHAPTAEVMIAARALLGVAGATLMPSTLALIRNIFSDPAERTVAIGVWGAMSSAGMAIGPILGGALLEHFWWGSVFLINVPVMVVLVIAGIRLLPESKATRAGAWDLPSVLLSLVGMFGVVYAIKELFAVGPRLDILLAAVVGVAALAVYLRRQRRLENPLLDLSLFANRSFSAAVLADLLAILGLSGLVFFLSQYFQLVQGYRPLLAGLAELPSVVGAIVFGLLAGRVGRLIGVRVGITVGLIALSLPMAALIFVGPHTAYPVLGLLMLIVGSGAGLTFTLTADLILTSAPAEQAGAASGVSETAYELGGALGIALIGSVVTSVYRGFTAPAGVPAAVADAARESLGGAVHAAAGLPDGLRSALLEAARTAFTDGLRYAGLAGGLVLLLAAIVVGLAMRTTARETEPDRTTRS
ncbi:MFS transporter [Microlunatus soli]|uniref:MFS transporter, DHA2 family, multidrug resistance protein n=1 Tax=Microlunatus soli TaxID=630515 RepID=A0A1H1W442_9ACTN|nr:MFS transporter [Microlunatus soli]SDS91907.1 MFS transporter, DHA2 family, multidrug resistance protein [Microlunatus soli]